MPTLASSFLTNEIALLIGATGLTGATGLFGSTGLTGQTGRAVPENTKETILTSGTAATFTTDTNCIFAQIIVVGGGGGGGGAASDASSGSCAGGGGAGGTSVAWYTAAELGATATYTVGTGGAGGTSGNTGTTGNASSFDPAGTGATLTANGGVGGTGSNITVTTQSVAGGAGGTASGGQINITGGAGGPSVSQGTTIAYSGFGGDSIFSGSGPAESLNIAGTAAGEIGTTNSGGGGSGAINLNSVTAINGGDGAAGVIIIIEFI